jgi:hypothetical protein
MTKKTIHGVKLDDMLTAKAAGVMSRRHESYITEEIIANDILSSVRKMTEYGAREIWYTKYSYSKFEHLPDEESRAIDILRELGYNVNHRRVGGSGLLNQGYVLRVSW